MGLFSRETPEKKILKELTGGFLLSTAYKDRLKKLGISVEDGELIKFQIKDEIKENKLKASEIPNRLTFLLNQQVEKNNLKLRQNNSPIAENKELNEEKNEIPAPNQDKEPKITPQKEEKEPEPNQDKEPKITPQKEEKEPEPIQEKVEEEEPQLSDSIEKNEEKWEIYKKIDKKNVAKKELIYLSNHDNNRTTCQNCGSELFLTDKYCYKCGEAINKDVKIENVDLNIDLEELYNQRITTKYTPKFKLAYCIYLKNLNDNKLEYKLSKLNVPIDKLKEQALKDNFIQAKITKEALKKSTVNDLKEVLKKYNLKVSGKKDILIERLLENLNESDLKKEFPIDSYKLTDEGEEFLSSNKHLIYYSKHPFLSSNISISKYENSFKGDTNCKKQLLAIYNKLEEDFIKNNDLYNFKNCLKDEIKIANDDFELLELYFKLFIVNINESYNHNSNLTVEEEYLDSMNELISSLKLELNQLQDIFKSTYEKIDSSSINLSQNALFKSLILSFNGKDIEEIIESIKN